VVSLNMEMGKRMGDIIGEMKRLQPDVLLLQEVDLCCPRSGNVDCAGEVRVHSFSSSPLVLDPISD
jgi:hypothetical protein